MNILFAEVLGIGTVLASVAGTTTTLYGRARRGSGRAALALVWIAIGVTGLTAIVFGLAPTLSTLIVLGGVVAASLLVCAAVLGLLRSRDRGGARRRDAALGYPPVLSPSAARIVSATGLIALVASVILIAPWMLIAATSAGIRPEQVTAGLVANAAVATPLVWAALASVSFTLRRRAASDADLLRRGIDTRVTDAEVTGYRQGFVTGREEGYRHAIFGTSWE